MAAASGKEATKSTRIRHFQMSWLDEDDFKLWLAPSPLRNTAHCKACNKAFTCRRNVLIKHSKSLTHVRRLRVFNNKATRSNNSFNSTSLSHKDKVKRAEIRLTTFSLEHNVASRTSNHLIPLVKDICQEPEIVPDLTLGENKGATIARNLIDKRQVERLVEYLKNCRFSILVDDTTDISNSKLICVLAQFVSPINKKVTTQLLGLVPLNNADCSADNIFESFKKFLDIKKIPLKNIVGMACDNASVMIECKNSFMTRFQVEVPNLVTLRCLCHSSAIIANNSCNELPPECEDLIRGVATYISGSAKRCAILVEFQNFFEVKNRKILKLSKTRWLCSHQCIVRLVENWDVLKSFFILAVVEDKLKSAETILEYLNDTSIKAYIYFLKYSLNFFNTFNALFQSKKILIHKLFESSRQLIIHIGQNFIKPEFLKDVNTLDLNDATIIVDINNVYVGPECEILLESLELECAQQIRSKCLAFYITAVRGMLERLPLQDTLIQNLNFLDPEIALKHEGRVKIKDLSIIAKRVNIADVTQLAIEWRILPSCFDEESKVKLASLEIDDMWCNILKFKNFDGKDMFPNLKLLVDIVLSLPHSNAEAERIFSIVADARTKKENKLNTDSLSSICVD